MKKGAYPRQLFRLPGGLLAGATGGQVPGAGLVVLFQDEAGGAVHSVVVFLAGWRVTAQRGRAHGRGKQEGLGEGCEGGGSEGAWRSSMLIGVVAPCHGGRGVRPTAHPRETYRWQGGGGCGQMGVTWER